MRNMKTEFFFRAGRVKHPSGKFPVKVRWKNSKPNWIKLNTDGSALDILKLASNGGIIKDHNVPGLQVLQELLALLLVLRPSYGCFKMCS